MFASPEAAASIVIEFEPEDSVMFAPAVRALNRRSTPFFDAKIPKSCARFEAVFASPEAAASIVIVLEPEDNVMFAPAEP